MICFRAWIILSLFLVKIHLSEASVVNPSNQELLEAIIKFEKHFERKITDINDHLNKLDTTLALINSNFNSMEGEIIATGERTSLTLTASDEGKLLQEKTLNEIEVLKHNISEEINLLNIKVVLFDESVDDKLNDTSALLQNLTNEIIIFNTNTSEQLELIKNDTDNMKTTFLALDDNMEQIKTLQNNTSERLQNIEENMESLKTPIIKLYSINDMVNSIQRTQEQIKDDVMTETRTIKNGVQNIQNTVNTIPSIQCPSSDGFFLSPAMDQCFKPLTDRGATWTDSQTRCQAMGLELAEPNNAQWLQKILNGKHGGKYYWVGGRGSSSKQYMWQRKNQALYAGSPLWLSGQPNDGGSSSYCVVLTAYDSDMKTQPGQVYYDNHCSNGRPYPLCERIMK